MTQEKHVNGITMGFTNDMYGYLRETVAKRENLVPEDSNMKYGRAIARYIRVLVERDRKKKESRRKSKKEE